MPKKTIAIAGAGVRGGEYGEQILRHSEKAQVVAVAEPRDSYRAEAAGKHGIAPEMQFTDWRNMAARPKLADAVIIATQDTDHVEPVEAFAAKGYDILLEKPMAPNEEDCRRIVRAAGENDVMLAVCHVLRYGANTQLIKSLIDAGKIGDIVSIQHLEPVGYWHQAHSFVRGNWRNEAESSFMLLAKCCHDIDWLDYIMGRPCRKVSSFGELTHFKKENQPQGAADRCLDCPAKIESACPYSACKIYLRDLAAKGAWGWPTSVLTPERSLEAVTEELRSGPYGRCVYACDNDVVDHQVVNLFYEGGRTASLTMTAFTPMIERRTRIFGVRGMLESDGETVTVHRFLDDSHEDHSVTAFAAGRMYGAHGGADGAIIDNFLDALCSGDRSKVLTGPEASLESHLAVFAAEKSRREGRICDVDAAL